MDNKNNDKLIQQCTCPICKAKVLLEYEKKVSKHNMMTSYNIRVINGCNHFVENELINENYVRLLNSLIQNRQSTYDELVQSRARRKLEELGLSKTDIRGLF